MTRTGRETKLGHFRDRPDLVQNRVPTRELSKHRDFLFIYGQNTFSELYIILLQFTESITQVQSILKLKNEKKMSNMVLK